MRKTTIGSNFILQLKLKRKHLLLQLNSTYEKVPLQLHKRFGG